MTYKCDVCCLSHSLHDKFSIPLELQMDFKAFLIADTLYPKSKISFLSYHYLFLFSLGACYTYYINYTPLTYTTTTGTDQMKKLAQYQVLHIRSKLTQTNLP